MIYVTIKSKEGTPYTPDPTARISFEELLRRGYEHLDLTTPQFTRPKTEYSRTHTFLAERTDNSYQNLLRNYPINIMGTHLTNAFRLYGHLLQTDMSEHYTTFHIPKHSGGFRRIDAPHPELMDALTHIKNIFEHQLFVLPHNAAHAYTAGRSIITAMKLHQQNESKWFLKLDLKDFFPSHNLEYISRTLEKIFPFSELSGPCLNKLIQLGLLNDSLPQGTPLSPLLTNILMTPIDYAITEMLRNNNQRQYFVYTRYADDLLISCKYHFNWGTIQNAVIEILQQQQTPFHLNTEKTRYGSSAGRNWNLGIMLNKDNNLTIGHKQNQRFRAAVYNFLKDLTNGNPWDKIDVQVLLGQISYYKAIEPDYVEHVIQTYSRKFNIDFVQVSKNALR